MKRRQQQHLQASQSPLMCALAIIIHIPSHPIAEGQCLCTRFSLPRWYAVVRFPVPHTEGQMGTLSLKRCCCNFGQTPYVTKRNKQAANSRYPVVALHHQDGTGGKPQADMLSWQFLDKCVITLKVAGSCHHLFVSWFFQSIEDETHKLPCHYVSSSFRCFIPRFGCCVVWFVCCGWFCFCFGFLFLFFFFLEFGRKCSVARS